MSYTDEGEPPYCFLPSLGRRRGGTADRALCAQQTNESFSFVITRSCRYFFLASDTQHHPRTVPHSLGLPPWHSDAHAGDEPLFVVAWHVTNAHPKGGKCEPP